MLLLTAVVALASLRLGFSPDHFKRMSLQFQSDFGHLVCGQFCWCSCGEIDEGALCLVGDDNWFDITKNIKEAPSFIVNQHASLPFLLIASPYPYCKSSCVISDSTPVTNSVVYNGMSLACAILLPHSTQLTTVLSAGGVNPLLVPRTRFNILLATGSFTPL